MNNKPYITYSSPELAWYETKELELPLPDNWQVEVCNMAGYNRPAMKPDEIKASISNPIGIPPIRELAKGKKEVVIIFDDMTRVTRVAKIVPSVLEELAEASIPDNRIRFNEEVMKCDLKIAIGSVVPHPMSGFGERYC